MTLIFQYNPRFYPIIGGGEVYLAEIIKNMPVYNFEIITHAIPNYPLVEKYSDNTLIRGFLPIDRTLVPYNNRIINKLMFPYKLLTDTAREHNKNTYLKKAQFDLLHVIGTGDYNYLRVDSLLGFEFFTRLVDFSFIQQPRLLSFLDLPSVSSTHPLFKKYELKLVKMFDNIICVDKHIYSKVQEYAETLSKYKNIWYIPNSVDTNKFSFSLLPNEEKLKVCFIGRLVRERGTQLLIELIRNLPAYIDLYVIVSGGQIAISSFKSKIEKTNVQVFSNVDHEDIPDCLKKVDVLLNPVMAEGISLVSLEAMSCGRPVIMLDMGDRYPIIDHKTGFFIENNLNSLLNLLKYLYENRAVVKSGGKNARAIVEKEFSSDVIIPKIQKIYEEIIKIG